MCLPQGLQNLPALLSSLIGNRKCNYHLIIIRNEFLKSIPSSRGAESRNSKGLAGLAETEHVTDEGTPHARTHARTHTHGYYTPWLLTIPGELSSLSDDSFSRIFSPVSSSTWNFAFSACNK